MLTNVLLYEVSCISFHKRLSLNLKNLSPPYILVPYVNQISFMDLIDIVKSYISNFISLSEQEFNFLAGLFELRQF